MIKRLIDVGIAVKNLDAAVRKYSEVLGVKARILPSEYYAYSELKGARFRIGEASISLVASEKTDSPVARFLETRGEGVNHISLEVTDIEHDMRDLAGKGVTFASDRPLTFSDGKVVFAHPKSLHGVQIAFVQAKPGIDLLKGEGF
jgi:methylmalonyl-CoA/ethylmalonyl-CoA epimerase